MAGDEDRVYGAFRPPDYFLVLKVSPEVSLDRKPDHRPEAIVAKCQAIDQFLAGNMPLDFNIASADGPLAMAIDADQPFEQVELALKRCPLGPALSQQLTAQSSQLTTMILEFIGPPRSGQDDTTTGRGRSPERAWVSRLYGLRSGPAFRPAHLARRGRRSPGA